MAALVTQCYHVNMNSEIYCDELTDLCIKWLRSEYGKKFFLMSVNAPLLLQYAKYFGDKSIEMKSCSTSVKWVGMKIYNV